jgi:hypothetical protein
MEMNCMENEKAIPAQYQAIPAQALLTCSARAKNQVFLAIQVKLSEARSHSRPFATPILAASLEQPATRPQPAT